MLSTEEVARRLGVKPATVYAYVSRGLLHSRRNGAGKGSLFDEAEVAAFAAGRRAATPVVHTGITLIRDGRLFYRGRDVADLARTETYESVVSLLWTGSTGHSTFAAPASMRALGEAVTAPLPHAARIADRLRVVVAAAAASDPLRFDTSPEAVSATGRSMLAVMVDALPVRAAGEPAEPGLAQRLWRRLSPQPPTATGLAALNAALVLLADHDLAASTLAARVAASTRAHPYAVVGAGLAVLDGPLHGAASVLAHDLLTDATRTGDPVRTISGRLRVGATIPGFGHPLYPGGDPRATTLLRLLRTAATEDGSADSRPGAPRGVVAVMDELIGAMARRPGTAPNIDFALAALARLYDMSADAGEAIFAVARTAGWIAHALEEYADRPSRFRPSGRYDGRSPAS